MSRPPHTLDETDILLLQFCSWYKRKKRKSPSLREISKGIYLSSYAIQKRVRWLNDQGYLKYTPRQRRSIIVLKNFKETANESRWQHFN